MLGCPLLHCLQFRGSTSKLWQPKSFWEDKRGPSMPVFRLYHAISIPTPSAPQGSLSLTPAQARHVFTLLAPHPFCPCNPFKLPLTARASFTYHPTLVCPKHMNPVLHAALSPPLPAIYFAIADHLESASGGHVHRRKRLSRRMKL